MKCEYEIFRDIVKEGNFYPFKYSIKNKKQNFNAKIKRYLSQTCRMVEYDIPEEVIITQRELAFLLQTLGYGVMVKYLEKYYIVHATFAGPYNANETPTRVLVTNAHMPELNGEYIIGENAVVIRHDSQELGLMPILSYYASQLVENELTMHMVDINSRMQNILAASDNNAIKSALEYQRAIENGENSVITDAKFADELRGLKNLSNSGTTRSLIDLIEYNQYLQGNAMSAIGIRAPFNMKREALGDSEVTEADMSMLPAVDDIILTQTEGFKEAEDLWGVHIGVKLGSAWDNIHKQAQHTEEVTETAQDVTEGPETEETAEDTQEPTKIEEAAESLVEALVEVIQDGEVKEDEKAETD